MADSQFWFVGTINGFRVMSLLPSPEAPQALLLLPHTLRWNAHSLSHTQTILLHTVYFLICLILWCKCSVLLWCGVGWWGWGGGIFGLLGGTEEVQCHLLSPSLLPPSLFEGRRSLCHLSLVRLVTEKLEKPLFCWNWSQAHSLLFSVRAVVFSRFFPVATIQHVSSSCWLTCI